ncbi:MAG: hypothetical protein Q8R02_17015 [Hyphomonadaceae bacterium]|nr:hypothetical protein [Hyphomonadaceae bacterium]
MADEQLASLLIAEASLVFVFGKVCLGNRNLFDRMVREAERLPSRKLNALVEKAKAVRKSGKQNTMAQLAAAIVQSRQQIKITHAQKQPAASEARH